jgi:dolichol-phosphate mannosyltransferase
MEGTRELDSWGEPAQGSLSQPRSSLRIEPLPAGQERPNIRLSVIVPTYNERGSLPELVRRATRALSACLGDTYELIIVDDDSPDRTWELAQCLCAEHPALRVIRRVGERGLSTAVIRGWQAARGEVLAVIDGDLQHPPELLASLWAEAAKGADLVVGSRHVEGGSLGTWSAVRRAISGGARLIGLLLLPSVIGRLSDPMSGCFLVRRSALAGRTLSPCGYKILIEVLARGSIGAVREVGYTFDVRRDGESKLTFRVHVDYVLHLLRLRLPPSSVARFVRFALAGASGVVVDMGLLFLLSDPRALGWPLTLGKVLAAEAAIVNNFVWNDAFTFKGLAPGSSSKLGRLARFNAICAVGLVWHVLLLHTMVHFAGINRYVANAAAIALVSLWNYALSLKLAWRAPAAQASPGR